MNNETTLTLASDHLTATIRLIGAQMISLKTAENLELMWHGDPAIWPEHAPILFPLLGPLTDQQLRHKGRTYPMPPHGFAQSRKFEIIEQSERHCLLEITDDAETRAMYPFSFRFQVSYILEGNTLKNSLIVTNTGAETLPCDVGFHPGFQWPLDPERAKEAYQITFDQPETAGIRRGVDDPIFLHGEREPTPMEGTELPLRDSLFDDQAIVFDQLNSRGLRYHADGGPGLRLEFPDSPHMALWMRPGASFIAIEPWQGLPVEFGWDDEYRNKPGTALIPAGETHDWNLHVKLESGQ
ncbi:MAG: aldose 1-epimerase family protein [Sphaerobacteraceae bacterium]|nr:MAG: aldose 1-epimerase family protein [Sphaerobacteraceae bacterium]